MIPLWTVSTATVTATTSKSSRATTPIGFFTPVVSVRLFETRLMSQLRGGRIGPGFRFLAGNNLVIARGEGEIVHRSGESLEQVV
jgi:hypothetical protein